MLCFPTLLLQSEYVSHITSERRSERQRQPRIPFVVSSHSTALSHGIDVSQRRFAVQDVSRQALVEAFSLALRRRWLGVGWLEPFCLELWHRMLRELHSWGMVFDSSGHNSTPAAQHWRTTGRVLAPS